MKLHIYRADEYLLCRHEQDCEIALLACCKASLKQTLHYAWRSLAEQKRAANMLLHLNYRHIGAEMSAHDYLFRVAAPHNLTSGIHTHEKFDVCAGFQAVWLSG